MRTQPWGVAVHRVNDCVLRVTRWAVLAVGLTAGSFPAVLAADEPQPTFVLNDVVAGSIADAPVDMGAALLATLLRMRGATDPAATDPVTFDEQPAKALVEPLFRYEGFDVQTIRISRVAPHTLGLYGRRLFGAFEFVDPAGRRALTGYGMEYELTDDGIRVTEAALRPFAELTPDVRFYVLPGAAFAARVGKGFDSHLILISYLAEHGLSLGDLRANRAEADYAVVAISMDRLPFGSTLRLQFSDGEKVFDTGTAVDIDFMGWMMTAVRAEMDLSKNSPLVIDALFAEGGAVSKQRRTERSVMRFVAKED